MGFPKFSLLTSIFFQILKIRIVKNLYLFEQCSFKFGCLLVKWRITFTTQQWVTQQFGLTGNPKCNCKDKFSVNDEKIKACSKLFTFTYVDGRSVIQYDLFGKSLQTVSELGNRERGPWKTSFSHRKPTYRSPGWFYFRQ